MNTPNNLIIENFSEELISENIFAEVWSVFKKSESISSDKIVQLTLTTSKDIIKLNFKFRGVNACTDVLSFSSEQTFLPILGDIIIDIETAQKQKGKKNLEEELQELFLHGLLHLVGYDHISQAQKNVMQAKEKKLINMIKENHKHRG